MCWQQVVLARLRGDVDPVFWIVWVEVLVRPSPVVLAYSPVAHGEAHEVLG